MALAEIVDHDAHTNLAQLLNRRVGLAGEVEQADLSPPHLAADVDDGQLRPADEATDVEQPELSAAHRPRDVDEPALEAALDELGMVDDGGLRSAEVLGAVEGVGELDALDLPGVSSAIIGPYTLEQARQNVRIARAYQPLTEDERAFMLAYGRDLAAELGPRYGPVV